MRIRRVIDVLSVAALLHSTAALPAVAVPSNGFWVARDIRQGLSEPDFRAFASKNNLEVKTPLPDKEVKAITIDGTEYWLVFCDGRLTYASWNINNNSAFIKSINQRLNNEGFEPSNLSASSYYNDREAKDSNQMTIKLVNQTAPYSITYNLFDDNGQVTMEDSGYDDSYGCQGDKP